VNVIIGFDLLPKALSIRRWINIDEVETNPDSCHIVIPGQEPEKPRINRNQLRA